MPSNANMVIHCSCFLAGRCSTMSNAANPSPKAACWWRAHGVEINHVWFKLCPMPTKTQRQSYARAVFSNIWGVSMSKQVQKQLSDTITPRWARPIEFIKCDTSFLFTIGSRTTRVPNFAIVRLELSIPFEVHWQCYL